MAQRILNQQFDACGRTFNTSDIAGYIWNPEAQLLRLALISDLDGFDWQNHLNHTIPKTETERVLPILEQEWIYRREYGRDLWQEEL